MINAIRQRWTMTCGYREVLKISLPLILSTATWSLQHFVDRVFLTWYSPDAIAASMPSAMANWTIISLFVGIAIYVNTFVAQYYGAHRYHKIGPAVWQGIYLSLIASIALVPFYLWAPEMFVLFGHQSPILELETIYFQLLLFGAPFVVISNAVSGFFSGLGKTWVVMWVNLLGTAINLLLDYLMIFGVGFFPEMGMAGAAIATDIAMVMTAAIFMMLFLRQRYQAQYRTRNGWRFNPTLFLRLLRFGTPNGMQFVLEIFAFTVFVFLVGRLGLVPLAASNIALNINMLALLPMMGLSMGVSILVGQHLGEDRPELAEIATWSAFHIGFLFFTVLGLAYFLIPELFLWPFTILADPAEFAEIAQLTAVLLRFVAFYCLFDAGNMVFSGAIKGAGDTRFVMLTTLVLSVTLLLLPSFITLFWLDGGIYAMWLTVTAYVCGLCLVFYWRFRMGKWREMRVIETAAAAAAPRDDAA
jgi:MATE family multidrug resistance protein